MNRMRNRPTPDRMGHLRRSASISIGAEASLKANREVAFARPDWMNGKASTTAKNAILVALDDQRSVEMIEEISHRKNDVVKTWKRYTKMRTADMTQRRMENSAWRLWFKRRIQQQAQREIEELTGVTQIQEETDEDVTLTMLSAYNLMSYLSPKIFSPPVETRRRSRSMGTKPISEYPFPRMDGTGIGRKRDQWRNGYAIPAR